MEYLIVEKESAQELVYEVNKLMKDGWEPIGSFAVQDFPLYDRNGNGYPIEFEYHHYQPMVRKEGSYVKQ